MAAIGAFFKDEGADLGILTGFAGTGKTVLIRLIVQAWRSMGRKVNVLAPTGRAALRVREAAQVDAQTIHRFLYRPQVDPVTGDVTFKMRDAEDLSNEAGALIIIDESSMVGRDLWTDLLTMTKAFHAKILLVGDVFQLEPVDKDVFCPLTLPTPYRAHLTEVVRQALDSPIMRAATAVRKAVSVIDVSRAFQDLKQVSASGLVDMAVEKPTMPILVHRNATRHDLNAQIRQRRGLEAGTLVDGEPLLVLKNCYDLDVYNGEIRPVKRWITPKIETGVHDRKTQQSAIVSYGMADVGMTGAEETAACICFDEASGKTFGKIGEFWLEVGYKTAWKDKRFPGVKCKVKYNERTGRDQDVRPPYLHCNYGYALTTHRAQGSEWDDVLVLMEPSIHLHTESGRRFVYTALTRAKKNVFISFLT